MPELLLLKIRQTVGLTQRWNQPALALAVPLRGQRHSPPVAQLLVVSLRRVMRYIIVILASLALLAPSIAHAKRAQAAKVEYVIYDGVRYVAPNDDGRRGYIQAWDTKPNTMLWELTIYRNFINPL